MLRLLPALLLVAVVALGGLAGVVHQERADAELAAPAPAAAAAPEPAVAPAATPEPTPPARPRDTFAHTCGMCHALQAAGVSGLIGPDLDAVRPSAARVRRAIRTGSLDGVMQPKLLRGREARAMATYVAGVAGRR